MWTCEYVQIDRHDGKGGYLLPKFFVNSLTAEQVELLRVGQLPEFAVETTPVKPETCDDKTSTATPHAVPEKPWSASMQNCRRCGCFIVYPEPDQTECRACAEYWRGK